MRTLPLRSLVIFLALGWVFPALASDVCCILAKKSDSAVSTMSQIASDTQCRAGLSLNGYTICTSKPDPQNLCSEMSAKDLCAACGYFWNGSCLTEDPVEVAKKKLKEEMKRTPTPTDP